MGGGWKDKRTFKESFFTDSDIWLKVSRLFDNRPKHMVIRTMGIYLYNLEPSSKSQLNMFDDVAKADYLQQGIDEIKDRKSVV